MIRAANKMLKIRYSLAAGEQRNPIHISFHSLQAKGIIEVVTKSAQHEFPAFRLAIPLMLHIAAHLVFA